PTQESPAFVGFSYSNTSSDRFTGDTKTAKDARKFMLGFMDRFPHLRSNDLYLSGESYGGHYVPGLALEIVRGNAAATPSDGGSLNLQGFLVGNAWTDAAIDNEGAVDFWWAHALIADETAKGLRDTCDFARVGPLRSSDDAAAAADNDACDNFISHALTELGGINIYEIYADTCLPASARAQARALADALEGAGPGGLAARAAGTAAATAHAARTRSKRASTDGVDGSAGSTPEEPAYDPCIDDEVEAYLNLPEVQAALHALPRKWVDCSRYVQYSREDLLSSMLPVYRELLANAGLRILVYSGDVDGIVPVGQSCCAVLRCAALCVLKKLCCACVGSRRWTAGLGLETLSPWRAWLSGTQQVGGYVVEYDGLTFSTVRNAGHMVPYVQPERMFYMFTKFLDGSAL
ncbi:hypothetical protein FOA52_008028, partial [Chlamydomonas sp. UWO 241]